MKQTPFPNLETERLILRQLKLADTENMFRLRTDPEVLQYLNRKPVKTPDEAAFFIRDINRGNANGIWVYWGVALKETDELIGINCLWNIKRDVSHAEIGYELLPAFQGKGLMSESVKAVVRYGFENMQLQKIIAILSSQNLKSEKLLINHRFSRNDVFKKTADPRQADEISYVLKREDYYEDI